MSKNNHTKAIREYNREISTTKIDVIIDRTIKREDCRNEPVKACKGACSSIGKSACKSIQKKAHNE